MAERLMDRSCEEFACDLASKVSVPGGGGAAAYVGALGAALASMVGHYTTGKKLYARYEEDVQEDIGKADHIRERLIELADMDAAAFYPLSKAYSIPKDDPDRTDIIERATKKACAAPIEMMRQTCKAIAILEDMYTKGTRMLLSDVGCGALFCRAALEAAALNVFVNTRTLQDYSFASGLEVECNMLLAEWVPRAEALSSKVMAGIQRRG